MQAAGGGAGGTRIIAQCDLPQSAICVYPTRANPFKFFKQFRDSFLQEIKEVHSHEILKIFRNVLRRGLNFLHAFSQMHSTGRIMIPP
jgi:hypothetical protein